MVRARVAERRKSELGLSGGGTDAKLSVAHGRAVHHHLVRDRHATRQLLEPRRVEETFAPRLLAAALPVARDPFDVNRAPGSGPLERDDRFVGPGDKYVRTGEQRMWLGLLPVREWSNTGPQDRDRDETSAGTELQHGTE
jgi:hypothetical protein